MIMTEHIRERIPMDPEKNFKNLPPSVKRRVKSLKKLQFETTKIEAEFYREVHELECKYQERYTPFYERRNQITTGAHEPKDEECDWKSEEEDEEEEEEEGGENVDGENNPKSPKALQDDTTKGVPDFWLTVFNNVEIIWDMIQSHDEPLLKHLEDLNVSFKEKDPMGFTLHFKFSPNEYFTNEVLTKEYIMKCEPSHEDPFGFEGPEIFKCVGCTIDWKEGKDVTSKMVTKTQKQGSKGTRRTVTENCKVDSFFNFFDPPEIPEDPNAQIEPHLQTLLSLDFEIGHYIREKVIPRAVLYFTGEAIEEEEEEEDDVDDESDESDDPDESDEDFDMAKREECKQQ